MSVKNYKLCEIQIKGSSEEGCGADICLKVGDKVLLETSGGLCRLDGSLDRKNLIEFFRRAIALLEE